jgi:nitric oxide reductase subunit B
LDHILLCRGSMSSWSRPWKVLVLIIVSSFSVLLYAGHRIQQEAPPIPSSVRTPSGEVLIGPGEILDGQNVWQAMGGMELGSVWGHGSYVAPDWTADYLHREALAMLDAYAKQGEATSYSALAPDAQAALRSRLQRTVRTNAVNASNGVLVVSEERALAFRSLVAHYSDVFRNGRTELAIPSGAQSGQRELQLLTGFFFWTAWAASTDRPLQPGVSYTNNWPHEPLVGNTVTGDAVVWTGVSIIVLLAGLAAMVWWHGARPPEATLKAPPADDPLLGARLTPSQRASLPYFAVVVGLFLLQIVVGIITAHFGVEGDGFYGVPLAKWLPYVVTRTWHTQLGIFWIATAWLAAGLFVAPSIGGGDPPLQRLGVHVLLGALVLVVLGSMAGEWASVMHRFSDDTARFYFGHSSWACSCGSRWCCAPSGPPVSDGTSSADYCSCSRSRRSPSPASTEPHSVMATVHTSASPSIGVGGWFILYLFSANRTVVVLRLRELDRALA